MSSNFSPYTSLKFLLGVGENIRGTALGAADTAAGHQTNNDSIAAQGRMEAQQGLAKMRGAGSGANAGYASGGGYNNATTAPTTGSAVGERGYDNTGGGAASGGGFNNATTTSTAPTTGSAVGERGYDNSGGFSTGQPTGGLSGQPPSADANYQGQSGYPQATERSELHPNQLEAERRQNGGL